MDSLNIGVAGCGIGGLAVATLLAKQGHNVTLFDQFSSPSPVGSGLVIQPVGLDVLRTIGAAEYALNLGAKIATMEGYETPSNRKVLNVRYEKGFGLAIHRASLFDALYQCVQAAECEIRTNATVQSTELQDSGRVITLTSGEVCGPFDLVIDASGANSPLSPLQAEPITYGALWGVVDWPANTALAQNQLQQRYYSANKMIGILPIGTMPKATIFWSIRQNDFAAWRDAPLADWKAEATALWPDIAPFLSQITSHDDLTMARYKHGALWKNIDTRLAFIGDAAHVASPQLGQGANMALLDAAALAETLEKYPLQTALPAYQKARRAHVHLYQLMSWTLTPMYQSESKIMPWLRNWILAPLSNIAPFPWLLSKIGSGNIIPPIQRPTP
ncbi:MAG: FAD-dependent monooxygenase [Rhodobacteraceae bacterium]|nr:FAD-dependent monooxygenase [Paracoccaceae bacterium]